MLTVSQLKQAYAYGAMTALKTAGYAEHIAQAVGIKLAEEAEMSPTGVQLMGPNPGEPKQPDENSLVEGDDVDVPQAPVTNEQAASPEAYAGAPSDDIYGALSE
jgi:hypothetical protein